MRKGVASEVVKILGKSGPLRPSALAGKLGITPQALHRHLNQLCAEGRVRREGKPPRTTYRVGQEVPSVFKAEILDVCAKVLGSHPAVLLVELFGSWARNQARSNSDIDVLVWLHPDEPFNRHDLWAYWDRQTRAIPWAPRVSLIVRKLSPNLNIDTLLLDMPEEHEKIFDRGNYFEVLREAVIRWRTKNGSLKVPSFGGKHSWRYSATAKHLDEIDFRLELSHVP